MKKITNMLPVMMLIATGCASSTSKPASGPAHSMPGVAHANGSQHPDKMTAMCPMKVPGTTVVEADIEGGASLVFSTTGDLESLRQRSEKMAIMHNQMPADDKMMNPAGTASSEHQHETQDRVSHKMPPSVATAEPTQQGARLIFRPKDPAQMDALRASVRVQAEQMESGTCPMEDGMHNGAGASAHH